MYLQITRCEITQSSCKRDTKSKSRVGMKLAPVRLFSCKHPLTCFPLKMIYLNCVITFLNVRYLSPTKLQYIIFKQASLTKKIMLFDKNPLCAYFFLDLDECTTGSHSCDVNSVCQNTVGSYTCSCNAGNTGDGKPCNGI